MAYIILTVWCFVFDDRKLHYSYFISSIGIRIFFDLMAFVCSIGEASPEAIMNYIFLRVNHLHPIPAKRDEYVLRSVYKKDADSTTAYVVVFA